MVAAIAGSPPHPPLAASYISQVFPPPMIAAEVGAAQALTKTGNGRHILHAVDTSQPCIHPLVPLTTIATVRATKERELGHNAPVDSWIRVPGGASTRVAARLAPRLAVDEFAL